MLIEPCQLALISTAWRHAAVAKVATFETFEI